jgi:4a-hydroxytetrahydrobiopterin dehydratase
MTDLTRVRARTFIETPELSDWRVLGDGVSAAWTTDDPTASVRLAEATVAVAGRDADIDLRPYGVTVRLITVAPGFYGITGRDADRARQISAAARDLGLTVDLSRLQSVQVTIDALKLPTVMSFWHALLGYQIRPDGSDEDLSDPNRRGPYFWFQQMDAPRPQRNRMHVDVYVPVELVEARLRAALAAGGRLVDDSHAPSFWVLADPEGNEACVAAAGWTGPPPVVAG